MQLPSCWTRPRASPNLVVGITGSADFLSDRRWTGKLPSMTKTSHLGDKPVNRIGFGAMQLAGPGVFGPPRDLDAARAVLRTGLAAGINHIDTSDFYGPHVTNQI